MLAARNRTAGALPLITYYDEDRGERTELSGTSYANWVDKTAGLLVDEVLIESGQPVRLDLARSAPLHWVTLVWVAACWRVGCPVLVGDASAGFGGSDAAVVVVGPDSAFDQPAAGVETIACSLHPLGLGFTDPLPDGVIDYGIEVRAQPDSFRGPFPDPAATAWIEDPGLHPTRLTQAEVITSSPVSSSSPARRTMIIPDPSESLWTNLQRALVNPVITGGSVVIMVGAAPERRAQVADAERVES
ncbi:TIGR03089 family protein [Microlunatus elymi]|uniref:TIGR03089 family protein n=1 Tax=Microlunatus elymi TaxID=2596828 RepID=A0A516Q5E3_9ACTN|nr:TIGR03089 family protein [Microlunatus elymi]